MADLGWEDDDVTWGGATLSSKSFAPVYVLADDFFVLGYDPTAPLDIFIERKGLLMVPGKILLADRVWPQIQGPVGGLIQVSLGFHDTPEGGVMWEGPYDFEIGSEDNVDFCIAGRYLAIRFESSGVAPWTLQSYTLDYRVLGSH